MGARALRELKGAARKAADKCADYLIKYRRYLRYDEYLATGLPIATGVVEGACRYLVKVETISGKRGVVIAGSAIVSARKRSAPRLTARARSIS